MDLDLVCPICDSDSTEIVDWPLAKCNKCGEFFDIDVSPHVEKIRRKPKIYEDDDES